MELLAKIAVGLWVVVYIAFMFKIDKEGAEYRRSRKQKR